VLALVPVALWFTQSRGVDRGLAADAGAPALAWAVGLGRLGCFLGGCCFGAPTSVPWGVVFPPGSEAGPHPVHPTQLYESAFGWLLLAWMLWREPRRAFKGELLVVGAVAYSLERFITEFFRGDAERGIHAGLGTSQIISIPVFVVSVGVWVYLRKHGTPPGPPVPPAMTEEPPAPTPSPAA
jgi:phosphatidylglycerol:prolipoprotein diacylglycerol transferase